MNKQVRQDKIMDILNSRKAAMVSDLSRELNASMMTIRRDLDEMQSRDIVIKIHGGAMLPKKESVQPSFTQRVVSFAEEKMKIGSAAATFIRPGNIVFFDGGTTSLALAECIPDDLEFTAISTGLFTSSTLSNKEKVTILNIGGEVHKSSYSTINCLAVENIKRFHADIAFVTTKAFCIPEGTFEAMLPLIEVKRAMVSMSAKVVLLADHSKFESRSLSLAIPLEDIDCIVTDNISKDTDDLLHSLGKEVIIAE